MNVETVVEKACKAVENIIAGDPFLVWNEAEFQILLQQQLLDLLPERVPFELSFGTRGTFLRPEQRFLNRVYREVNLLPRLGRQSTKPDIIVLQDREHKVLPKNSNESPSSFTPPFQAVIETKVAINWSNLGSGSSPKKPTNRMIKSVTEDFEKYAAKKILKNDIAEHFYSVVLTTHPECFPSEINDVQIIAVKYPSEIPNGDMQTLKDAEVNIDLALEAIRQVHLLQQEYPLEMLREKDFETSLVGVLRQQAHKRLPLVNENGEVLGSVDPIRSQWSTSNPLGTRKARTHDVIILDQPVVVRDWGKPISFHPIGFEYELKTSHSDHNWFIRKKGLMDEIEIMSEMLKKKSLKNSVVVLFRYGFSHVWESDVRKAMQPYRNVPLYFLTAKPGSKTEIFI